MDFQGVTFGNKANPFSSSNATKNLPISDANVNKLATAFQLAGNNYYLNGIKEDALVNGAINGLIGSLNDPYSVYMNVDEAKEFNESVIESQISGIGCEVSLEDGRVTVISPIKGSPAEKSGIRARDVIISVNGERLEGLTLNEAVKKIRGEKGTQAELQIMRPGSTAAIKLTVIRDEIDVETIFSNFSNDNKIGVIEIRQFAQNTGDRFLSELALLEKKGMKGLIIDVRNDPGGLLPVAMDILKPLIPAGKAVVKLEDRDGKIQTEISDGKGKKYPIAVLINNGSASASEILAAALNESANATLVGETSFGKGLVQSTYDAGTGDGSTIKLTIAKWLTPNGNFINKKGIQPNVKIAQPAYFTTVALPKDKPLKYDMLGDDVKNLQQILIGLGLKPGRLDGYFDSRTVSAVKNAQAKYGLAVTGVVDSKTAEKLEEKIIEKIMDPANDAQLLKAKKVLLEKM
jgi:carboxyl-terminal processing protease